MYYHLGHGIAYVLLFRSAVLFLLEITKNPW